MLADEYLIQARGWGDFTPEQKDDKYLDFAHLVAKTFQTESGKQVLEAMVKKYLTNNIAESHDTMLSIGIKQGKASLIKEILGQIEISQGVEK